MDRNSHKPIIDEPELIGDKVLIKAGGGEEYILHDGKLMCSECKKVIVASSLDSTAVIASSLDSTIIIDSDLDSTLILKAYISHEKMYHKNSMLKGA